MTSFPVCDKRLGGFDQGLLPFLQLAYEGFDFAVTSRALLELLARFCGFDDGVAVAPELFDDRRFEACLLADEPDEVEFRAIEAIRACQGEQVPAQQLYF